MTRKEVMNEIEKSEREGVFDNHIDPIPKELIVPVTEDYNYTFDRTFFEKIKFAFEKALLVKPFTLYQNWFKLKTSYIGRENLKGLGGAVLTCNHVTKFDCLAVKHGARRHRTFVLAAPFNNMKGLLGELMRAGDMLPLNTTVHGNMKFNNTIKNILIKKKKFLLVYPEASMWWNYKKPRPYKDGAFNIAVKYNVPVVPQFITFKQSNKFDEEGINIPKLTLHISKPIYPKDNLSRKENVLYLKNMAFNACKEIYEKTYNIPLSYTFDEQSCAIK